MKWENKKRKQKLFSSQNCKVFLVHSTSGKKYDEVKIWPLNESFTSKRTRWKSFSWFMCCNIQTFYCKMIHVDLKLTWFDELFNDHSTLKGTDWCYQKTLSNFFDDNLHRHDNLQFSLSTKTSPAFIFHWNCCVIEMRMCD